jgi:ABC-type arginine/histidine transport system permease subunit
MNYMYDWQVGDEDVGIIMSTYLITIASVIYNYLLIVASLCLVFHLALICVVMGMSRNDLHNSLNTKVVFFPGTPLENALGMLALTPLTIEHGMVNDESMH